MLYGTFNASRETVFEMVGLNLADETTRRKKENEENLSEIYVPYPTSYNSSGDDAVNGRPPAKNPDAKNLYDKDYNDNVRE